MLANPSGQTPHDAGVPEVQPKPRQPDKNTPSIEKYPLQKRGKVHGLHRNDFLTIIIHGKPKLMLELY